MKILQPFLIACVICCSLLNSGYFGNVSLAGYFGFCITSVIGSLIIYFQVLKDPQGIQVAKSFREPGPLGIFLILTIYIYVHGFFYDNFNLSHYYWLAAAILFLNVRWISAVDSFRIRLSGNKKSVSRTFSSYLHPIIALIAIIESIIVIFQWLGLFPSMNELFACTGTWVNPNITAMFLALSLFSQKRLLNNRYGKTVFTIQLTVILLAIVLLQSRTAYIVAAILLFDFYKHILPNPKSGIVKISAIALIIFLLAFTFKSGSTDGRIQIWKNCLQVISTNPITGVGFGQFEKEYNAFVAGHNLPSADHVYMPYNDFLELAVEGGPIAVILWIAFLGLLLRRFRNNGNVLALNISFIVIQLTNFGFQAIPVFALFLVYTGSLLHNNEIIKYSKETPVVHFVFRSVLAIGIIGQLFFCTRLLSISNAFHRTKLISEGYPLQQAIEGYETLATILEFSSTYHENKGDLFMQSGNYRAAGLQYRRALQTTSRPDVLGKCGWCYGQLRQYDSAAYYFGVIEKLQPYKYAPRMALLKLFEQKKDTISIKLKAREIMAMPVKVQSEEVDRIKSEAGKWVEGKL